MKKSILSISVFSLLFLSFFLPSCRKTKPPIDPCKNKVLVTATDPAEYQWGHFRTGDNTYLFAENWNQYANKVIPGRQYRIGYKETECKNRNAGCQDSFALNGIREGGCVLYPNKCMLILCMEEVRQSCFETVLFPADFGDVYSQAFRSTGITGDALNATVSFSGCSQDDAIYFKLYAEEQPTARPTGPSIWAVKAVNTYNGVTCQAVFTKDVCFDLTPIKKAGQAVNQSEAIIRMMVGGTSQDFTYKF